MSINYRGICAWQASPAKTLILRLNVVYFDEKEEIYVLNCDNLQDCLFHNEVSILHY